MGPAHVVGCFAAGAHAGFHGQVRDPHEPKSCIGILWSWGLNSLTGLWLWDVALFLNAFGCHTQTKTLQANHARRPTPQSPFLNSGRARGITRLHVAQPAGELCVEASSSSSSTVTIPREEDALSDAQPVSTSKTAGRSVSYEAEEQAGFSGRVATVSFHGRIGRNGSFGLQIDTNRTRLRRRVFAELRMHLDDGQNLQPILLGRRRRLIEEQRKKAEDAQRRKMAEARRQQVKDRVASSAASSNTASSSAPTSAPSSPSPGSQAPSGKISSGPKPKGTIPKDAVGNVVAHNLDLKPSKTTKVIPEGFAVRIQSVSSFCFQFFLSGPFLSLVCCFFLIHSADVCVGSPSLMYRQGIVLPILPHIMVVSGGLGREELEDFASQRVLSSLLTLDVPKELCTVSMALPETSGVSHASETCMSAESPRSAFRCLKCNAAKP